MKFIHCFDENLKNQLLQNGYKLITSKNGVYIFENNSKVNFNFEQFDNSQFIFSNKMVF